MAFTRIYLPDDPFANLGKAMFYVGYAWVIRFLRDREVDMFSPPARKMLEPFERIIWLWPVAYIIDNDEQDVHLPSL